MEPDGSMQVPPGAYPVGWYDGSPTPGELGPAVLAGDVDWEGEPGACYGLRELRPGDTVVVDRADVGSSPTRPTRQYAGSGARTALPRDALDLLVTMVRSNSPTSGTRIRRAGWARALGPVLRGQGRGTSSECLRRPRSKCQQLHGAGPPSRGQVMNGARTNPPPEQRRSSACGWREPEAGLPLLII